MEPRYVLGSVIGIAALLAIALAPFLRNKPIGRIALLLLFATFAYNGITGVRGAPRIRQDTLASLILSPRLRPQSWPVQASYSIPRILIYLDFAEYYEPDADVRSHMALIYSRDEEMRWNHFDTASRIVLHLKSFTPYAILPYESLASQPGEHIFVVEQWGWDWTRKAFAAEHAEVMPIGQAFGCEVVSVRFPGSPPLPESISRQPGTVPRTALLLH